MIWNIIIAVLAMAFCAIIYLKGSRDGYAEGFNEGKEEGKQQILNENVVRISAQHERLNADRLSIVKQDDTNMLKAIIKGGVS
jgi:flagellar biosynthesis/type III secretory pathway protein FliH